jgi:hypothetical protein
MRTTLLLVGLVSVWAAAPVQAQVRGVYPTGMSATNSGGTPAPGVTYSNLFLFNSRDQLLGPDGAIVNTGQHALMIDLNTLTWVSRRERLGGAKFSMAATLLVSSNSLQSDTSGAISSGGGFGDLYLQPVIFGWKKSRADVRAAYGILAPTGRFEATANDNVGSGYWTHAPSVGATFYLSGSRSTALSGFYMHEFHTEQQGSGIHPGQTANIDYSVTHTLPLGTGLQMQVGLVGYGQWQTTDKTGPGITPAESATRYGVNALGFVSSLMIPDRKTTLNLKYFKEFAAQSTFQGYTLHISIGITF